MVLTSTFAKLVARALSERRAPMGGLTSGGHVATMTFMLRAGSILTICLPTLGTYLPSKGAWPSAV
jgi:hypothetical protein